MMGANDLFLDLQIHIQLCSTHFLIRFRHFKLHRSLILIDNPLQVAFELFHNKNFKNQLNHLPVHMFEGLILLHDIMKSYFGHVKQINFDINSKKFYKTFNGFMQTFMGKMTANTKFITFLHNFTHLLNVIANCHGFNCPEYDKKDFNYMIDNCWIKANNYYVFIMWYTHYPIPNHFCQKHLCDGKDKEYFTQFNVRYYWEISSCLQ